VIRRPFLTRLGGLSGLVLAGIYVACSSFDGQEAAVPGDREDGQADSGALPESAPVDAGADAAVTDIASGDNWSVFNVNTLVSGASFLGGVYDGHNVYFVPKNGRTVRYDTTLAFSDGASWTQFDLQPLIGANKGLFSGTFDGRYVYYAADGTSQTAFNARAARFDTQGAFADAGSWQAFTTSSLFDAGAGGASGSFYDGTKVVFMPASAGLDAGNPDAALVYTRSVLTEHKPGPDFADASAWTATEGSSFVQSLATSGFEGVAFDGKTYAYQSSPFSPQVLRVKRPSTAEIFDLTTLVGDGRGYLGAVFDGRYVYYAPTFQGTAGSFGPNGVAMRYDTQAAFNQLGSYQKFDIETVKAGARGYAGGVFDGRFVYYVPAFTTTIIRFDTTQPFINGTAWTYFDASSIAQSQSFTGGVFDGQYVYFIPASGGFVLRFKARNERIAPPPTPSFL
jgi:hypothetical protein